MANVIWDPDTTAVAQIDTVQLSGTWAGDGNITTTMTAEDGSTTQTVVTATTSGSTETNRDAHLTALQASTNTLFTQVTWSDSGTDSILGTAKVAGVPFYAATTEDDSTGSVASDSTTTANVGLHDWNTAGNWSGGSVPTGADEVFIPEGSTSIFYGLDQSGITLTSDLHISPGYTGKIGDHINGYYLQINGTSAFIHSYGGGVRLKGTWTNVYVAGGQAGPDMVRLSGTITNLYVLGSKVNGTVTVADSATLTNGYQFGATGAKLIIGSSGTVTLLEVTAGTVDTDRAITTLNLSGGASMVHKTGAVATSTMRGGTLDYRSSGAFGASGGVKVYDGFLTFTQNKSAALTVTNLSIFNGTVDERSGLQNITHGGTVTVHGGNLILDTASTAL